MKGCTVVVRLRRLLSIVGLTLVSVASVGSAEAQLRLAQGTLGAFGGSGASARYGYTVASGNSVGSGRGSSATRDVMSGFVGGAFPAQATISFTTSSGVPVNIALPMGVPDSRAVAVLDELGAVDRTVWNFGHWSPADSAYRDMASAPPPSVGQGQGYWLITKGAATVRATGLPTPLGIYSIPLSSGPGGRPAWNQAGNPFMFEQEVSALLVTDGVSTVALADPANTFTESVVKIWSGSAYSNASSIPAKTGFWIKRLKATGTVTLLIVPKPSTQTSPRPVQELPAAASWGIQIVARQGDRMAEPIMIGASPIAQGQGWNRLCLSSAPSPPGEHLRVSIPKLDWGALSGAYVNDFEPDGPNLSWDFVVAGAESPGDIDLSFTEFDVPRGTRIWLSEQNAGWTKLVSAGQSISVRTRPGQLRFRVSAIHSEEALASPAPIDGFRQIYPNPSSGRTGIVFGLARGGDVVAEIFDLTGRRVIDLSRPGLGPGDHVLVWDGRDASGQQTRPGVYMLRWQLANIKGSQRIVRIE